MCGKDDKCQPKSPSPSSRACPRGYSGIESESSQESSDALRVSRSCPSTGPSTESSRAAMHFRWRGVDVLWGPTITQRR